MAKLEQGVSRRADRSTSMPDPNHQPPEQHINELKQPWALISQLFRPGSSKTVVDVRENDYGTSPVKMRLGKSSRNGKSTS